MTTEPTPTPNDLAELIRILKNMELAAMAIAAANPPNWKRPLSAYRNGWVKAIGAIEIARDQHGPAVIFWMGHHYTRRSSENKKFGAAIWFSRAAGKDEAGNNQYLRLITFEDSPTATAEPLPGYVVERLG